MDKISNRRWYWLSGVVAFFSFLYYLIPEPKDNPYMKIYSSQEGGGFAWCEFASEKRYGVVYRFNLTQEDCRRVIYNGGDGIRFTVEYPGMAVVDDEKKIKFPVYFYMEKISMEGFDANRHLSGERPISVEGGVETYDVGGFRKRKFTGGMAYRCMSRTLRIRFGQTEYISPDCGFFISIQKNLQM